MQVAFEVIHFGTQFSLTFAIKLGDQHAVGLAFHKGAQQASILRGLQAAGQANMVDDFYGGRTGLQDYGNRGKGCKKSIKMNHGNSRQLGARHQSQFDLGHHTQGALGAAHQFREVETMILGNEEGSTLPA